MTTVEIILPDQLANEAAQAGLLAPEAIELLLREKLRRKALSDLFEVTDRVHSAEDPTPMSLEEIQEEVKAARAERRAQQSA
jgi:hypothetical protein